MHCVFQSGRATLSHRGFILGIAIICTIVLICNNLFSTHTSTTSLNTESVHLHSNKGSETKGNQKVLCYILLSLRKLSTAQIIKQTWGSHCDKLIFFGRFHEKRLPVTFLNTTEGWVNLWGKTKSALIYLQEKLSHDYNWFVKADDDTFVIVENLKAFIKEVEEKNDGPLWFGYKLKHKRLMEGYMSGGAGYVFNKQALRKVTQIFIEENIVKQKNCDVQGRRGIEDLELGKCFLSAGVKDISTVDNEMRERFLPLTLSSFLNKNISAFHWIWRQAWDPIRLGKKCCSPSLISIHQVTSHEMRTLYFLLYTLQINTAYERKISKTNTEENKRLLQ